MVCKFLNVMVSKLINMKMSVFCITMSSKFSTTNADEAASPKFHKHSVSFQDSSLYSVLDFEASSSVSESGNSGLIETQSDSIDIKSRLRRFKRRHLKQKSQNLLIVIF